MENKTNCHLYSVIYSQCKENVLFIPEHFIKMEETFKVKVLNDDRNSSGLHSLNSPSQEGTDLIKELKISLTSLKSNFMDEHTGKVNYEKMLESEDFASYRRYKFYL